MEHRENVKAKYYIKKKKIADSTIDLVYKS